MKLLLGLLALLFIELSATDLITCKSCHPIIYNEFQDSIHKKSSINEDKVHKAIWDKHPAKAKGNYKCAKCHTPNNEKHQGITCISCHTISGIKEHSRANENIYETKDKFLYSAQKGMEDKKVIFKEKSSWFGLIKETTGSPYHDIDYSNKDYYTGKMCMGCHSHKQNSHEFNICNTDKKGAKDEKQNCITCHMPKVKGSATNIRISEKHAFHGFAGVRNSPELLSKYIDITYRKSPNGFNIIIHNKSPHNLLIHPLRVVKLKTTIIQDGKSQKLKDISFVKILGTNGKPSMPWLATEVIKDNMIKDNEKRIVSFSNILKKGVELEIVLGYYIVNPKIIKELGLDKEADLKKFIEMKKVYFKVQ